MIYLFLGAILFWTSENWTLFQAFYFVFISMSTIGFGDFVPSKVNVLMYAFIYLLFGLALTSMCINVIQEKLSSVFEMTRLTLGETIGLDPSTPITIMEPESEKSSKDNSRRGSQDVDKDKDPKNGTKGSKSAPADKNNNKDTKPSLKESKGSSEDKRKKDTSPSKQNPANGNAPSGGQPNAAKPSSNR